MRKDFDAMTLDQMKEMYFAHSKSAKKSLEVMLQIYKVCKRRGLSIKWIPRKDRTAMNRLEKMGFIEGASLIGTEAERATRDLPKSVRKSIAEGKPLPLVIGGKVEYVKAHDMGRVQLQQAICKNRIRTPEEQKEWLEDQADGDEDPNTWSYPQRIYVRGEYLLVVCKQDRVKIQLKTLRNIKGVLP